MKRFTMLLIAGLLALGCSKPAPQTTPTDARSEERALEQPVKPAEVDKMEKKDANEEPSPEVSGYGSDPGEDTQE